MSMTHYEQSRFGLLSVFPSTGKQGAWRYLLMIADIKMLRRLMEEGLSDGGFAVWVVQHLEPVELGGEGCTHLLILFHVD